MPSKKFIFSLISILLLGGGWWFFAEYKESPSVKRGGEENDNAKASQALAADSDGDVLRDWEEILWKTDPYKKDTDGDGTNDNEEILAGRNPIIAGPDDKLAAEPAQNEEKTSQTNETDTLAKEFGAAYLRHKFTGTSDASTNMALTQTALSGIQSALQHETEKEMPPTFSARDIPHTTETSSQEVKTYVNNLAVIITSPPQKTEKSVLEILSDAATADNVLLLKILSAHSENYASFAERMKNLAVPQTLVTAHVQLVNNFLEIREATNTLSHSSDNAAANLVAFARLTKAVFESPIGLGLLVDEIKNAQITFSEEEPGKLFSNYVALRK